MGHREGPQPTTQSPRISARAPTTNLIFAVTSSSLHAMAVLTLGTANLNASVGPPNNFVDMLQWRVLEFCDTGSPNC